MKMYAIQLTDQWSESRSRPVQKASDRVQPYLLPRRSHPTQELRAVQHAYYLERRSFI